MKFREILSDYLNRAGATQRELSDASGFSRATISRFCSGKKEPAYNSEDIEKLAKALCNVASKNSADIGTYEEIYNALRDSVEDMLHVDYEVFLENLNHLLKYLGVKNTELASGIYSDLSHVSRILAGNSRPGNPNTFIHQVATYLALRYTGSNEVLSIAKLIDVSAETISTSATLRDKLIVYLGSNSHIEVDRSIPRFLEALDEFDLGDYLKAVHFDEIKIPSAIPHLSTRKEYTGIQRMMDSEIDFMKTTVLSKSMEDCILYSDMPLEEMAADPEFPKKYMLGVAMMLKKGLHLHIIHDVNRPFPEMMLGLEAYIPLYMTGQISPYYLTESQSRIFMHFLKVSGVAALEGTAIAGNQASGKYVLYRSKEDVKHYRTRAGQLLAKAHPLMDIYRSKDIAEYRKMQRELLPGNDCKMICSNIPIYFLPQGLLTDILKRSKIGAEATDTILAYYEVSRETFDSLPAENRVHLVLPSISKELFGEYTPGLSLADLFMDEEIALTYEEYAECLDAMRALASENKNFILELNATPTFHNINIAIAGDRRVIVSKEKSPTIHFVIRHKKMIRAFQNFIPPIVE